MLNIDLAPAPRRQLLSLTTLEWAGCILALVGAGLLSLRLPASGYGFAFYLASNLFWIGAAVRRGSLPMLLMQMGFTLTSISGLWNWVLR